MAPVYPRRCGEQLKAPWIKIPIGGLSPQVRGTGSGNGFCLQFRRFIPAGAGNRGRGIVRAHERAVYPRRCGEQQRAVIAFNAGVGLSPQVRGTVVVGHVVGHHARFIPAGAGNRVSAYRFPAAASVYPRRCGEQYSITEGSSASGGLSPQVRGTVDGERATLNTGRFIPAGAGNSSPAGAPRPASAVYPRRCGEQRHLERIAVAPAGLSPQVRGTDRRETWGRGAFRFIPAGAGNSIWIQNNSPISTVYPRRCGEQCEYRDHQGVALGLSPQVRGTDHPGCPGRRDLRFIPAGAGNRDPGF